jgi:NAD+ kinase
VNRSLRPEGPNPPGRVGLVIKPSLHQDVTELIAALADWLRDRDLRVAGEEAARHLLPPSIDILTRPELSEFSELVVVIGGDGTMISAARMIGKKRIPVLGINFGFLGYLTEYTPESIFSALEAVLSGRYRVDVRMKLETIVFRDETEVLRADVINDCVLTKSMLARLVPVHCNIDGQFVSVFHADGLIIATPTGSTAYSLSAGGPIIHPAMGAVVMTPICPHTLTNRPLVVSDESEIELTLSGERGKINVEDVFLTLDGQTGCAVLPGDRIIIRKSDSVLMLVEPENQNYFKLLRDKLKWGGE